MNVEAQGCKAINYLVVMSRNSWTCLPWKSLQRQIGVVTLVSSQEQRALLVPVISRSSTGRFVPATVYIRIPLFVLPKRCSGDLSSMPWRARGTVVSCANKRVGVPCCRARPAQPPRRAPPDPTRSWSVKVLDSTGIELKEYRNLNIL